jgi:hypothetical protein
MAKKPFSREGVDFWIVELMDEGRGYWASFEGFLLREFLARTLTLEHCNAARSMYKDFHDRFSPVPTRLPSWKLMARFFLYRPSPPPARATPLPRPILKRKATPIVDWDGDIDVGWVGEIPVENIDLPWHLAEMLAGR